MPKRITSIDVAQLAGVSQSTVSRVYSAGSKVSEDKRERVLKAAEELGYHPNAIARSLITQRSNIIGIVMANITSPFYPYVLDKFLQHLAEIGKQALLFTAAPNQEIDDILPLILQHQVDGLIVTSATLSSEMAERCHQQGTPVILFNRTIPDAPVSAVCCDNVAGGGKIADLLLDNGHQRLAYIAGTANTSTNIEREAGFTAQLKKRSVENWFYEEGNYSYESGYDAAIRLMQNAPRPDAIFCANDIMAIGAMDAIRAEFNLTIPDDVSVIGFDDIPMARWAAYDLTTISQPVDAMIDEAIALLLEKIENPDFVPTIRRIAGELVLRGSVKLA